MSAQYLLRRNGWYHFRIRVPKDLSAQFGKSEIQRSLHTRDRRVAKDLGKTVRAALDRQFAHERQKLHINTDLCNDLVLAAGHKEESLTLSEAIAEFTKDRTATWTAKTLVMHEATLRDFLQIMGDKSIDEITRRDCRKFRDLLLRLPPRWKQRFRGLPAGVVAAKGLTPMSHKTVNRNVGVITGLFGWLVKEEYLDHSPARGLAMPVNDQAHLERDIFGTEELRAIFHSPLYRGCASLAQRWKAGSQIIMDHKFWMPLIGLYTGMRLEEIAQLRTSDLKDVDGVWVFDVNAAEDKRLKTPQSRRLIPIHGELIRLGLLRYRNGVQTSQLWPDLGRAHDGSYSASFSKWFGRFKVKVGVINPKVTFHSFRHTFINQLKQAGAPESIIKELVGHKDDSITFGRYGKRYQAQVLAETIAQVSFPIEHGGA